MTPGQQGSNRREKEATGLQACLDVMERAVFRRSRGQTWRKELGGVIADLGNLNQATEADFLAVGGNLMAFLTASRQLNSDIGALTALVSGEQAQHAAEALVSVRGYVRETQHLSETGGRTLLGLQASAERIHRRFSTLGRIALSFRVTAILARIETSHLSTSADLGNLVNEVRSCGDGMQVRADQILEATVVFSSNIASALGEVSRLDAAQQKELPPLLEAVDADLGIFDERQKGAAKASANLAADLASITGDLGAIATSIQFHDITRQQTEHVIQALTSLLSDAPKGGLSASGAAEVRLQKAQLESAASSFGESTRKIDRDLAGIAARVEDMSTAGKLILGADSNEEDTFIDDMQRRLARVLHTMGESSSLQRGANNIVAKLEGLSQSLRASVSEVQAIELQLSRIAINAAVSASHLGVPGRPLNVVADAMQELRIECASRSSEADADLDSIDKAIVSLAAGKGEKAGGDSSSALLNNLTVRMDDLRSASASGGAAAAAVAALASALCGNLQEARNHFKVGEVFAATATRCGGALDEVAAEARPMWPFHEPAEKRASEQRYTMQVERDVDQAVAEGVPALHPEGPPPEAAANEAEFF